MKKVGVIGGSGLYEIEGLAEVKEIKITTPFGRPSDNYIQGKLGDNLIFFLSRHARGHLFTPSEVNYRANIYGMKKLGVERIISVSAVGSMKKEIKPGEVVIIDQFFDRTKGIRPATFFGDGCVGHVAFADPICRDLAQVLYQSAKGINTLVHQGGTYLCIEGPQFSTRAESNIYRQWGVDVIGMTNIPEAKLAREAGLCYATIALSTDYDCWNDEAEDVSVEAVLETMKHNVLIAKKIIKKTIEKLPQRKCNCGDSLKFAVMTERRKIPAKTRQALKLLLGRGG